MSDIRANMATLERAKEGFRHQLSEYKRDNERLTEKLALATNDKRELERKVDQLNAYITQLQQSQGAPSDRQSVSLQLLVDRLREENSSLRREKDELQEAARKWLDSRRGVFRGSSQAEQRRREALCLTATKVLPKVAQRMSLAGVLRGETTPLATPTYRPNFPRDLWMKKAELRPSVTLVISLRLISVAHRVGAT